MEKINRNNYEEYFLLYADNELDAETKLAVENFIQQNADLTVELEMLLQTKSLPDNIEFTDKELLLKTEGNSINVSNHEEYFLLYIDNELSAAKREEVERYVLQHPKLQDEFTMLKQAVLTPEDISYGSKEDLYHTEKRRTVLLKPWRFAAAAIFIGVCAVGILLLQKNKVQNAVAVNHPAQIQQKKTATKQNPVTVNSIDSTKQITQPQQQTIAQQSLPEKENKNAIAVTSVKKKREDMTKSPAAKINNDGQQVSEQNHTVITHNTIVKEQKEPPVETNNDVAVVPEGLIQKQPDVTSLQTSISNNENNTNYKIYPVAYKEINTNDDDNSLHVGMLDLNKTKVKNLLKKAGRMFSNKQINPANDDGKLQVASFEIDTK